MEKTSQQKSNDNFMHDMAVENYISEIKAIKRKLILLKSDSIEKFKEELSGIVSRYNDICTAEYEMARAKSQAVSQGGNKSRYKKLKRRSNKTKKIKGKRFRSQRNKK